MDPLKLTCSQQLWLHSSVGRALHRYRRGHGFESRWSLNFFQASLSQLLKLRINREDLSWRHWRQNQYREHAIVFLLLLCRIILIRYCYNWWWLRNHSSKQTKKHGSSRLFISSLAARTSSLHFCFRSCAALNLELKLASSCRLFRLCEQFSQRINFML